MRIIIFCLHNFMILYTILKYAVGSINICHSTFILLFQSADKEIVTGIFTCAVCKCIGCVSEFMEKLTFDQSEKEKYPPKLLEDWKEFFSPSIYNSLIPIYVDIAGLFESSLIVNLLYDNRTCMDTLALPHFLLLWDGTARAWKNVMKNIV